MSLSRVADSRLIYRSLIGPAADLITVSDLVQEAASVFPGASGAPPAGGIAPEGGSGASTASSPPASVYRLTEEKRTELFVRFINRLVDLLFQ